MCDASSVIYMLEFLDGKQSFPGQNGFLGYCTWVGVALIKHACFHKISSNFPSRKHKNPNKICPAPDPITFTEFEVKRVYSFQNFNSNERIVFALEHRKLYSKYGKKYH